MSRIGKKPITIPAGVEVKIEGSTIRVKGVKGALQREVHPSMNVALDSGTLLVIPKKNNDKLSDRFHGLTRTLLANMVEGVTVGYKKQLQLVGVGYRAAMSGINVDLSLGFSHPIHFSPPVGVVLEVEKQTLITVSGASKEDVGETAAKIRSVRPPEPYHGKGVRYLDEKILTKVGKASGKK